MIDVLLLAAGVSRRMGAENKLLLPFGSVTLLEATFMQLETARVGPVTVVTGHESERVRNALKERRCRFVFNPDYELGLSSSIRAGVRASGPDTKGWMVCLGDMPLIGPGEYRLLAETFVRRLDADPAAIVRPRFNGQSGHPVLFSAPYLSALLALEFPDGARPILLANPEHLLLVDMPDDSILLDADTPAAYRRLLERKNSGSI